MGCSSSQRYISHKKLMKDAIKSDIHNALVNNIYIRSSLFVLNDEETNRLLNSMIFQNLPGDHKICKIGEASNGVYVVLSGHVVGLDDRSEIIYRIGPGECAAADTFACGSEQGVTYITTKSSIIYTLMREDYESIVHSLNVHFRQLIIFKNIKNPDIVLPFCTLTRYPQWSKIVCAGVRMGQFFYVVSRGSVARHQDQHVFVEQKYFGEEGFFPGHELCKGNCWPSDFFAREPTTVVAVSAEGFQSAEFEPVRKQLMHSTSALSQETLASNDQRAPARQVGANRKRSNSRDSTSSVGSKASYRSRESPVRPIISTVAIIADNGDINSDNCASSPQISSIVSEQLSIAAITSSLVNPLPTDGGYAQAHGFCTPNGPRSDLTTRVRRASSSCTHVNLPGKNSLSNTVTDESSVQSRLRSRSGSGARTQPGALSEISYSTEDPRPRSDSSIDKERRKIRKSRKDVEKGVAIGSLGVPVPASEGGTDWFLGFIPIPVILTSMFGSSENAELIV